MANQGGRPTKYDKDFHPSNFIRLSKEGKCNLAEIAMIWRVDRHTVYSWAQKHPEFSDAIKKGRKLKRETAAKHD